MSDKIIENNQVTIMGKVATEFSFSHEVFGEGFYMVEVEVKRLSNSEDRIPLMISERLIDVTQDYTGEYIMVSDSSALTIGMKSRKTVWYYPYLYGRFPLWKKNLTGQRPTVSGWMAISARNRSTGRHRLEGRLQIFCLRLTAHMENRITFHVSAGGEMQDMPPALKWESMYSFWEGSRAGNM